MRKSLQCCLCCNQWASLESPGQLPSWMQSPDWNMWLLWVCGRWGKLRHSLKTEHTWTSSVKSNPIPLGPLQRQQKSEQNSWEGEFFLNIVVGLMDSLEGLCERQTLHRWGVSNKTHAGWRGRRNEKASRRADRNAVTGSDKLPLGMQIERSEFLRWQGLLSSILPHSSCSCGQGREPPCTPPLCATPAISSASWQVQRWWANNTVGEKSWWHTHAHRCHFRGLTLQDLTAALPLCNELTLRDAFSGRPWKKMLLLLASFRCPLWKHLRQFHITVNSQAAAELFRMYQGSGERLELFQAGCLSGFVNLLHLSNFRKLLAFLGFALKQKCCINFLPSVMPFFLLLPYIKKILSLYEYFTNISYHQLSPALLIYFWDLYSQRVFSASIHCIYVLRAVQKTKADLL